MSYNKWRIGTLKSLLLRAVGDVEFLACFCEVRELGPHGLARLAERVLLGEELVAGRRRYSCDVARHRALRRAAARFKALLAGSI